MIETKRLKIYPASQEQLKEFIETKTVENCKLAYSQILNDALKHSEQWDNYTIWMIDLKNNDHIGELCINRLPSEGILEIGCGIDSFYDEQGYANEAVEAFADWVVHQELAAIPNTLTNERFEAFKEIFDKCRYVSIGAHRELVFRFTFKLNSEGNIENDLSSLTLYEVFRILEDKYGYYDIECELDEFHKHNKEDELLNYFYDRLTNFKVSDEKKILYEALDMPAQVMFIALTDKYGDGWKLHKLLKLYPDDDLPQALDSHYDYLDRVGDLYSYLKGIGYNLDDI
ncbi:MAG: GNAT family N-acetyltransferase [Ruminococcus albus]|jgi:ribosomal-protein-alanine N-acetyltransferase|nr:GNAT family N-acetyltransferase [Ruminococcus albus]